MHFYTCKLLSIQERLLKMWQYARSLAVTSKRTWTSSQVFQEHLRLHVPSEGFSSDMWHHTALLLLKQKLHHLTSWWTQLEKTGPPENYILLISPLPHIQSIRKSCQVSLLNILRSSAFLKIKSILLTMANMIQPLSSCFTSCHSLPYHMWFLCNMKLLRFSYSPYCFPSQAFAHVETPFPHHGLGVPGKHLSPCPFMKQYRHHLPRPLPTTPILPSWNSCPSSVFSVTSTHFYHRSVLTPCCNGWFFCLFPPTAMRAGPILDSPFVLPVLSREPWTDAQQTVPKEGACLAPDILLVINVNLKKFLDLFSNHFRHL